MNVCPRCKQPMTNPVEHEYCVWKEQPSPPEPKSYTEYRKQATVIKRDAASVGARPKDKKPAVHRLEGAGSYNLKSSFKGLGKRRFYDNH
jgi:hypothetical protein